MMHQEKIAALVLYGFKWHVDIKGLPEINGEWRVNNELHIKSDFTVPETIMPEVLNTYIERALQIDPKSSNGPRKEVLIKNCFLNPGEITIDTLIVHGHKDPGLDIVDSVEFYSKLKCKKYYSIIYGAHPLHMETNYTQLLEIIHSFLL